MSLRFNGPTYFFYSLLSFVVFSALHNVHAQTPTATAGSRVIYQIKDYGSQWTREGAYEFSIDSILRPTDLAYVNVVIDFNQDDSIAKYTLPWGSVQSEWVIRNVPLPMNYKRYPDPRVRIWFQFADTTKRFPGTILSAILITNKPLGMDVSQPLAGLSGAWNLRPDSLRETLWGSAGLSGRRPTLDNIRTSPLAFQSTATGFELPGPLDPDGLPDLVQRNNECAPTSTSNSLLWLARKHGFEDKLPKGPDSISLDTARIVLDLKKAMKNDIGSWSFGVTDRQMFSGQRKIRDEFALPLAVRGGVFDKAARGSKTFEFIMNSLKSGHGLQLGLGWSDTGGHWVTVRGYAIAGGRAFLYVHDPGDGVVGKVVWELEVDIRGKITGELVHPGGCTADLVVAQGHMQKRAQSGGRSLIMNVSARDSKQFPPATSFYLSDPAAINGRGTIMPVSLKVLNLQGHTRTIIKDQGLHLGVHSLDLKAGRWESGLYFYRFSTGKHVDTRPFVVLN